MSYSNENLLSTNQLGLWDVEIVSGCGQYHSNKPTANKKKAYISTTLLSVKDMVRKPNSVTKEKSHWALFTTYLGEQARSAIYLRGNASFIAAWADIDSGDHNLNEIVDIMDELDTNYIIYSSRSATENNKKWRVIVPYSESIKSEDHILLIECLNDHIERNGVTPDRVTEHINQLCYLPNKGEFYEYFIEETKGDLE